MKSSSSVHEPGFLFINECGRFMSIKKESDSKTKTLLLCPKRDHLNMKTFSSLANDFWGLRKCIYGLSDGKCIPSQGKSLA